MPLTDFRLPRCGGEICRTDPILTGRSPGPWNLAVTHRKIARDTSVTLPRARCPLTSTSYASGPTAYTKYESAQSG